MKNEINSELYNLRNNTEMNRASILNSLSKSKRRQESRRTLFLLCWIFENFRKHINNKTYYKIVKLYYIFEWKQVFHKRC